MVSLYFAFNIYANVVLNSVCNPSLSKTLVSYDSQTPRNLWKKNLETGVRLVCDIYSIFNWWNRSLYPAVNALAFLNDVLLLMLKLVVQRSVDGYKGRFATGYYEDNKYIKPADFSSIKWVLIKKREKNQFRHPTHFDK